MMNYSILLVDDEKTILEISKRYLEKEGYTVYQAVNAKEAIVFFENNSIDLIITDIMMPEMDGYDLIIEILDRNEKMPFIFITAKNSNQDRLYSLTLGADDYITKPFNPLELVLRVKNILRRIYGEEGNHVKLGDLEMNLEKRVAKVNDYEVILTSKEFMLLWILSKQPDKVFSKSEILNNVWGGDFGNDRNTVNVHIHRLREKLNQVPIKNNSPVIKTVWGTGYKIEVID